MDDLPPDLDRLFDQQQAQEREVISEEEMTKLDTIDSHTSCMRCKCGEIIYFRLPCYCPNCQEPKCFWRMLDGIKPLPKMDLGHLSNTIKVLALRAEKYPTGEARKEIEIAMDIIYAEIGSRDLEIKQATGIHNTLKKSLASNG